MCSVIGGWYGRAWSNPRHDSRIRARPCSSVSSRASPSASGVSFTSCIITHLSWAPVRADDSASKDRSRLPAGRRCRRGRSSLRDPVRPHGARASRTTGRRSRATSSRTRSSSCVAGLDEELGFAHCAWQLRRSVSLEAARALARLDVGGMGGPRRPPVGDRSRGFRAPPRPLPGRGRPAARDRPPQHRSGGASAAQARAHQPPHRRHGGESPGFTPTCSGWRSPTISATPARGCM